MITPTHRRPCEFRLLRYVPDAVRNEFVHIGVLLRAAEPGVRARTEVRFTRDWRRVRCLDPDADTALLEAMEGELRRRLEAGAGRGPEDASLGSSKLEAAKLEAASLEAAGWMRILDESLSLNVQMTEAKAYLAESLPAGVEELMRLYVDPPPRERAARLAGRAAIHARMRAEFERAGVWDLLRKRIAASAYTRPGDPLRIDAGYRPNGVVKMFHAVSLEAGTGTGVEMAKVLAFSADALRAGVSRVERAELELTAIVEPAAQLGAGDAEPDRLAVYRFGVETLEEHRIRVLTTSEMVRVAETARRELVAE